MIAGRLCSTPLLFDVQTTENLPDREFFDNALTIDSRTTDNCSIALFAVAYNGTRLAKFLSRRSTIGDKLH